MERVSAERAYPDRTDLGIPHHDRILRAPLPIGPLPHRDEINLGFEGRIESVLPPHQGCENREILSAKRVRAGTEHIRQPSFIDEDGTLAFPNDELRAHFDFVLITRKAVREDIALRSFRPLDDVDELAAQFVQK